VIGDAAALKYAKRDLETLNRAMALAPGYGSVVQAGGSLGVFAISLGGVFDAVYCFEPHPSTFRKLVHNVSEYDNVICMQAALGCDRKFVSTSRERRRKTHLPPHDGVTHVVRGLVGYVPTLTVDDLGLKNLGMLVLDTEGQEYFALKGAEKTVELCKPVVMIEINENCEFYDIDPECIRDWLRERGYRLEFCMYSDEVWKCPK